MKTLIALLISFSSFGQIQTDKMLHFGAGYIVNNSTLLLSKSLGVKTHNAVLISLGTTVLIGTAKEVYDLKVKQTKFDFTDITATFWGGLASSITYVILIETRENKHAKL